jgi:hypothetical protein
MDRGSQVVVVQQNQLRIEGRVNSKVNYNLAVDFEIVEIISRD